MPAHLTALDGLTVEQPTAGDYTEGELVEFRGLMTDLLAACTASSAKYAPDGGWSPAGTPQELDEAADLIAELSRTLTKTRRAIRKINTEARKRASGPTALP
ncbi:MULTISPECIES: hypothetical protein [unclassified Streptomyces]|uniref:hypothetical protein n=1 Tax=unclassified Streptomyces TaxID=2593676 RepID=UPI003668CDDE